ncbi:MAG: type II toxin-antitoxin system VapC family toxin [Candidatus Auribacterota bacterium]|nr:type II toxin-antitoxin system VapC family toxin [Candidatus Auribacterota bacterium]
MKYMLDTNICIYVIKKKPKKVIRHLQGLSPYDVCISSITLSELEYGVEKSERRDRNKVALAKFIAPLEVIAYDDMAAGQYGKIRSSLEKKGRLIGALDMLIAAHALSQGLILVTNNEREFKRVRGIKIENWAE